jgi:hypothetical protein
MRSQPVYPLRPDCGRLGGDMMENILSKLCVVALVNDDDCLNRNLLASDLIAKHNVPVQIMRGAVSAGAGYNAGLDSTDADYVIFAHQDVYFPADWHEKLAGTIEQITECDPNWAIIAPFGICAATATHIGDVWSSGVGGRIGGPMTHSRAVQSVDELVIVMRRAAGLRFDPLLPGYHLYGTDLVQLARSKGLGAYVADLAVVHNDSFKPALGYDFTKSYRYVRRKWKAALPLRTPVLWVTRWGFGLPFYRLRAWYGLNARRAMALDTDVAPRDYAHRGGWE